MSGASQPERGRELQVSFTLGGTVESVTIVQPGFQIVTVLSPGSSDLFIAVPRFEEKTKAGGFRGSVDISAAHQADMRFALVGRPLPANLLEATRTELFGEPLRTEINAPELGTQTVDLMSAGYLMALGNKRLTEDFEQSNGGLRCQGSGPGPNGIGCAVVRTPRGPTAAWSLGGQLGLCQLDSISRELGANELGKSFIPRAETGLPLRLAFLLGGTRRRLFHAADPLLDVEEFPKAQINPNGPIDCADPTARSYEILCRSDFAKYRPIDLIADAPAELLSVVSVADLPSFPGSGRCADTAILVASTVVPGRGLIPLGFASGFHDPNGASPSCRIDGAKKPFGAYSIPLPAGSLPLALAPRHAGLEGLPLVLLLLAADGTVGDRPSAPISAVVARRTAIASMEDLTAISYVPGPTGVFSRSRGTFTFSKAPEHATFARLDIESRSARWLVYSPIDRTELVLPSDPTARAMLADAFRTAVDMIRVDGAFVDLWRLGSGKTLDHLPEVLVAFTEQECTVEGQCGMR